MIIAGVDPGSETGLVCLDVPESGQVVDARWITHAVVRPTVRQGLTEAERDANLFLRLAGWFGVAAPEVIVFEEPMDAAITWRGHRHQARGTAFRLGAFYGLAVAAAWHADSAVRLVSYPVTNRRSRPGWMRGKKHDVIVGNMAAVAKMIAPTTVRDADGNLHLSEHVLMALGVLTHHLSLGEAALTGRLESII